MAVQTPETKEEQDSAYNPVERLADEKNAGISTSAGIDQAEAFANDPANASESVKDQEETPDQIPFTGSGSAPKQQSLRGRFWGSAKKNSAVTGIIGVLLSGAFGLSLLSPGLLLVQLKETLNDKFNDQLAAMDLRQTAILKKKLNKTTTSGVCGKTLTIRCKYQTIGDRHIKRLEKAGIKVVGEKNAFNRTRPASFEFEGKSITAPQLLEEARNNPSLRSAMRHGYNPKFAAFSDAITSRVNTKLLLKKSKNITPSSDTDKMKEDLKKAASGETDLANGSKLTPIKDGDGNITGYENPDDPTNPYGPVEGERINLAIDEVGARGELASSITKNAVKGGIKGALTVTALGAGTVDSACTVWNLIRVAGFAAKIYGQRQLIRYSYEFMKTADAIKAGDATPEEVSYLSTILTTPNSVGSAALDSIGYKYAAYGDTFAAGEFNTDASDKDKTTDENEIKNETAKYVNGQILPDNAMASVIEYVGGGSSASEVDSTCGFVKSWQGQTALVGLAVAGAVIGFFSAGTTVGGGAVAQGAFSVAAAVAIAAITPKLVDMAKGELVTGNENGNEAGNAITSGAGGYNAQVSQGRGLAVLNKQDAVDYAQITETVVADYGEVERSELSPFDATSKNTLVGGIANSILPYTSKLAHSGSTLSSLSSLVSSSFGSIITPKISASDLKVDELEHCDDPEYEGLAADPFCNLRYGLSKSALAKDPEEVLTYMENGGYIEKDSEIGTPGGANGDKYQEYIDQCIERENSIGDKVTESDEGGGDNCVQGKSGGDEERNTMFRLFYIDMSVQEGMDSDFEAGSTDTSSDGPTTTLKMASFNILGSNHDGENKEQGVIANYKTRMKRTVEVIQRESFDVIGFQEFVTDQRKEFNRLTGDTYKLSSNEGPADGGNGIGWNASKYDLLSQGTMPDLQYTTANSELKAPWVQLKDKVTGYTFYFANTHDPANVHSNGNPGDGSAGDAARRTQNAKAHVRFMESKVAEGTTVFMTGDFNSSFGRHSTDVNVSDGNISSTLPYCVMTSSDVIQNAFDIYKKRDKKCPNQEIRWEEEDPGKGCKTRIDHLYVASTDQSVRVDEFGCIRKGGSASTLANGNGSDHDTVKFTVSVGSNDASNLSVATYNITRTGENGGTLGKTRRAAGLMKERGVSIIGVQEIDGGEQYQTFLSRLGSNFAGKVNESGGGGRAIFWDKTHFTLGKSGFYEIQKDGEQKQMVWVELKASSGKSLYVFDMHADVGRGDAEVRRANARDTLQAIDTVVGLSGDPVVLMGDMNSNYTDRTEVYDILKEKLDLTYNKTNNLKNADCDTIREGIKQECGRKLPASHGDHIYVSRDSGIVVNSWENVTQGTGELSDHNPVIASLTIPSLGSEENTATIPLLSKGGWVWPTKGPITDGPCYGVANEFGNHAGMDINTPSSNLKVYAMHDGEVVQNAYDGSAGNYILIKSTDGIYYSYQHLKSKPSVSGNVTAGQEIGVAGKTGNVKLRSSAAHLHITMATKATLGSYSGHPDNIDPMTKLKPVKPAGYSCSP